MQNNANTNIIDFYKKLATSPKRLYKWPANSRTLLKLTEMFQQETFFDICHI